MLTDITQVQFRFLVTTLKHNDVCQTCKGHRVYVSWFSLPCDLFKLNTHNEACVLSRIKSIGLQMFYQITAKEGSGQCKLVTYDFYYEESHICLTGRCTFCNIMLV